MKAAQSKLDRAEQDRARTFLTAPFSGLVASVEVDPYEEIVTNEAVISLQGDGALEVLLLVPETIIRDVEFGQAVLVSFPTLPAMKVSGTVIEIGASAQAGNAFPVKVSLDQVMANLRPEMIASVTFNFTAYLDGQVAYLVPLSALAIEAALVAAPAEGQEPAGDQARQEIAPLFVLDRDDGTIELRKVKIGGLRGNEVEVLDALQKGELVVSAGVAFLRNGMKAEAWTPR